MQRMRDVFIEEIYHQMHTDENIFFVTADFGSPKLDLIRKDFPNNFLNAGIAEQNLINVSTGLALEGFTVYSYAISTFMTMRAFEQIRNNLALMSRFKCLNINLISVGAGLSYDMSGPSHHCLEDLSIMRTLPNIEIFSPSDNVLTEKFFDYSVKIKKPKYIRLDGKPLPDIYDKIISNKKNDHQSHQSDKSDKCINDIKIEDRFYELRKGKDICIISTGIMTQTALALNFLDNSIGIIDMFMLRPLNENLLFDKIKDYKTIITMEEGFINKGGLDSLISSILNKKNSNIKLIRIGFEDKYIFDIGSREYLHRLNQIDAESIIKAINYRIDKFIK